MRDVMQASSLEGYQKLNYDYFEDVNIMNIVSDPNPQISKENQKQFDDFNDWEEKMKGMRKEYEQRHGVPKQPKKEKTQSKTTESSQMIENGFFGVNLEKTSGGLLVIIAILILLLGLLLLWKNLFMEPQINQKKKRKIK